MSINIELFGAINATLEVAKTDEYTSENDHKLHLELRLNTIPQHNKKLQSLLSKEASLVEKCKEFEG